MKLTLENSEFARILAMLRQGYAWWISEISALIPQKLQAGKQSVLTIRLSRSGVSWIGPDGRLANSASIEQEVTNHYGAAIDILVEEDLVLDLLVTLPVTAEPHLRTILTHMMSSLVPLSSDALTFDFAVESRNKAEEQIDVAVAVIKKQITDEILAALAQVELPLRNTAINRENGPDVRFRFFPRPTSQAFFGRTARPRRILEGLIISLLLSATMLRAAQQSMTSAAFDARTAELRTVANNAAIQNRRIKAMLEPIDFLRERMKAPSVSVVLGNLAQILPDTVWISELHIHDDKIEIVGLAGNASDLVTIIEASKTFMEPKFQAPITAGDAAGSQRFAISLIDRGTPTK